MVAASFPVSIIYGEGVKNRVYTINGLPMPCTVLGNRGNKTPGQVQVTPTGGIVCHWLEISGNVEKLSSQQVIELKKVERETQRLSKVK